MIAASFRALASCAPVSPVVLRATSTRSIVSERVLSLGVRAEDRLAAVAVRRRHENLAVEAAGAEQRLVELLDLVRGGENDHGARVALEAVELDQQLVEGLLALRGPAVAGARAAMPADGVELVDEDHRAPRTARFLEEAADPRRAAADEHLDEARSGGREEVHAGVSGDGSRQHRLAGARRSIEEHAAWRPGAEDLEPLRVLEPFGDVDQLLLGGIHALDLFPEHGCRLARLDRLGASRAHRAPQQDHEDDQDPGRERDPEDRVPGEEEVWDRCKQGHMGRPHNVSAGGPRACS